MRSLADSKGSFINLIASGKFLSHDSEGSESSSRSGNKKMHDFSSSDKKSQPSNF